MQVDAPSSSRPVTDGWLSGLRNRLFQWIALYIPGNKTSRIWLHRKRGVSIGKNVSIGLSALIETAYPRLVSIGDNVTIGMRVGHHRAFPGFHSAVAHARQADGPA